MATARVLHRALTAPPPPPLLHPLRTHQTLSRRRYPPPPLHDFATPSDFLGSWKNPPPMSDPREAEIRLDRLRKDYAKQVKQLWCEYLCEMEIQRAEQKRKDDAKCESSASPRRSGRPPRRRPPIPVPPSARQSRRISSRFSLRRGFRSWSTGGQERLGWRRRGELGEEYCRCDT